MSDAAEDEVIRWLLDGDAAIRWQVERDLLGLPESEWSLTRSLVAEEGWGRHLLDRQDPGGTWGGGLYTPKWTSTTYTLLLLRRMGLSGGHPRAAAGGSRLLDDAEWVDGGVSFFGRPLAERCVNGMVLSVTATFTPADDRVHDIAALLLDTQMPDGGWNCRDHRGATHASFHTTISVLEGLAAWRAATGEKAGNTAIEEGHDFLLRHHMFRSHRSGEVIDERWTRFHFPPRWHYDVLRGLEHLASEEAPRDVRAAEAVDLVRQRRRADGRWGKGSQYTGETFFQLELGRVPGRWNSLRALRVLRWWASPDDRRPGPGVRSDETRSEGGT